MDIEIIMTLVVTILRRIFYVIYNFWMFYVKYVDAFVFINALLSE